MGHTRTSERHFSKKGTIMAIIKMNDMYDNIYLSDKQISLRTNEQKTQNLHIVSFNLPNYSLLLNNRYLYHFDYYKHKYYILFHHINLLQNRL